MSVNEWDVASSEVSTQYTPLAKDEPREPNPFGDDGQLSSERASGILDDRASGSTSLNGGGPAKDQRRSRVSGGRVSARSSGAELDRASMHEHAVEKGSTMQVQ